MKISRTAEEENTGPDAGSLDTTVKISFSPDERPELFGRRVTEIRIWYHQLSESQGHPDWTHGGIWLDQPIEDGRKEFPFYEGMPGWIDDLTREHSPAERYGRSFHRAIDLPAPK